MPLRSIVSCPQKCAVCISLMINQPTDMDKTPFSFSKLAREVMERKSTRRRPRRLASTAARTTDDHQASSKVVRGRRRRERRTMTALFSSLDLSGISEDRAPSTRTSTTKIPTKGKSSSQRLALAANENLNVCSVQQDQYRRKAPATSRQPLSSVQLHSPNNDPSGERIMADNETIKLEESDIYE